MNGALSNSAIIKKFTQVLETGRYRKTPERFAILNKILSFNSVFSIEKLCFELENESYHVSKATVYNNVDLLVEAGILRKLFIDGFHSAQYEKISAVQHTLLVCTQCSKIKSVKDEPLLGYMNAKKYNAFQTSYYSMCVYGVCNACARKLKKNNIQQQKNCKRNDKS